jgi:hypothetical protein
MKQIHNEVIEAQKHYTKSSELPIYYKTVNFAKDILRFIVKYYKYRRKVSGKYHQDDYYNLNKIEKKLIQREAFTSVPELKEFYYLVIKEPLTEQDMKLYSAKSETEWLNEFIKPLFLTTKDNDLEPITLSKEGLKEIYNIAHKK